EVLQQGLPVVLNFWAGLCPPCRQEMPDFQEISEERAGEVLILGIDVGRFTNLGSQQDALDLLADDIGILLQNAGRLSARISPYRRLG
ncbi:MAG: TlpA family protein disulfide reductase, partial [Proteobacteria bacterium]|nr:TlpA family protein disulfide reductase [Pseudomonadota bacterium]